MIIGISGKAQSGKDTTAKIFRFLLSRQAQSMNTTFEDSEQLGLVYSVNWDIRKFAGKLKSSIEHKFPQWFSEQMWESGDSTYRNQVIPQLNRTRRQLLIDEAMAMRALHPNYWVEALMQDYMPLKQSISNFRQPDDIDDMPIEYTKWLITDLRFKNEFKAIVDRSGITIRVERSDIPRIQGPAETELDKHVIDGKFDYIIYNNSSLEQLVTQVKTVLTKMKLL